MPESWDDVFKRVEEDVKRISEQIFEGKSPIQIEIEKLIDKVKELGGAGWKLIWSGGTSEALDPYSGVFGSRTSRSSLETYGIPYGNDLKVRIIGTRTMVIHREVQEETEVTFDLTLNVPAEKKVTSVYWDTFRGEYKRDSYPMRRVTEIWAKDMLVHDPRFKEGVADESEEHPQV